MHEVIIGVIITSIGALIVFISKKVYDALSEKSKNDFWNNKLLKPNFLTGTWEKKWKPLGQDYYGKNDKEIWIIKKDGKVHEGGKYWFNINHFVSNPDINRIKFALITVLPDDERKLENILTVHNNNFITGKEIVNENGKENHFDVEYKRQ